MKTKFTGAAIITMAMVALSMSIIFWQYAQITMDRIVVSGGTAFAGTLLLIVGIMMMLMKEPVPPVRTQVRKLPRRRQQ